MASTIAFYKPDPQWRPQVCQGVQWRFSRVHSGRGCPARCPHTLLLYGVRYQQAHDLYDVRCKSSAPTCASRKAIARLTAAGDRPSLLPAPTRLPSSTADTNTFIASMRSKGASRSANVYRQVKSPSIVRQDQVTSKPKARRGRTVMLRKLQLRSAPLSIRIEAEILELLGPVRVGIPQALDIDAAREAAVNRCLDELGSKECEREREIGLAHRASLALCQ